MYSQEGRKEVVLLISFCEIILDKLLVREEEAYPDKGKDEVDF